MDLQHIPRHLRDASGQGSLYLAVITLVVIAFAVGSLRECSQATGPAGSGTVAEPELLRPE